MDPSRPDIWQIVTAIATAVYTLATIVLVGVTIANVRLVRRYTDTTARTVSEMEATRRAQVEAVEEMRRARAASIRPRLVPFAERVDPRQRQMRWGVKNVGVGPALSVDVRLRWWERMPRRLRCTLIEPGEVRLVKVCGDDLHPDLIDPENFVEEELVLILVGTCKDVADEVHAVDERAPLLDQWKMMEWGGTGEPTGG